MTRDDAIAATYGTQFIRTVGKPIRVRVSGRCKTWKTRPTEFQLPVEYGLYESGYITHENAHEWESARNA